MQHRMVNESGYRGYRTARLVSIHVRINETIPSEANVKTMKSINVAPKISLKSITKEKNINDKMLDIARDRGLSNEDLLEYDFTPSTVLFDNPGMMTTSTKSQLITELEKKHLIRTSHMRMKCDLYLTS